MIVDLVCQALPGVNPNLCELSRHRIEEAKTGRLGNSYSNIRLELLETDPSPQPSPHQTGRREIRSAPAIPEISIVFDKR